MNVVFDGCCLGPGPVTGVPRAFLDALAAFVPAAPREVRCTLLLPAGAPDPGVPGLAVVGAPRGALLRQLVLPRLLRLLRADVLHSPVAAVPLGARCPRLATAHDLPWLHPELGERTTFRARFAARRGLAAATAILAPSTATADDVRRLLGGRCPPVHVVPHGTALGPAPTAASLAARTGPFVALGDDRPRKNRERVRAGHALAAARCPGLPPLRFVGPPDDWVDEATKRALLRDCRAVVQGSWFEGFGLPVLEALAHGAPVAAADLSPFREIAGAAARWFDPFAPESIAEALLAVHGDAALRERLATEGHRRAAERTPTHTAARWRALHLEVAR